MCLVLLVTHHVSLVICHLTTTLKSFSFYESIRLLFDATAGCLITNTYFLNAGQKKPWSKAESLLEVGPCSGLYLLVIQYLVRQICFYLRGLDLDLFRASKKCHIFT